MTVHRKSILIVDYNKSILDVLRLALANVGIQLITASSADEAERALRNVSFDLVVSGMRLKPGEGKEGFDLLAHIKKTSPETKVIIMTAYGTPESEQEAYNKGAFLYLNKPFDLHVLEEHLGKLGFY